MLLSTFPFFSSYLLFCLYTHIQPIKVCSYIISCFHEFKEFYSAFREMIFYFSMFGNIFFSPYLEKNWLFGPPVSILGLSHAFLRGFFTLLYYTYYSPFFHFVEVFFNIFVDIYMVILGCVLCTGEKHTLRSGY